MGEPQSALPEDKWPTDNDIPDCPGQVRGIVPQEVDTEDKLLLGIDSYT